MKESILPDDRTFTEKLDTYANIATDQARQAREAANALFKPRQPSPPATEHGVQPPIAAAPATLSPASTPAPHAPRVLSVSAPHPEIEAKPQPVLTVTPAPKPEAAANPPTAAKLRRRMSKPSPGKIPQSEHGQIRALATYGMTTAQVAEVYEVPENVIEDIVK
jgi:hypothetical protein